MITRADDLTAQPAHFGSTAFVELIKSNALGYLRKNCSYKPLRKNLLKIKPVLNNP